MVDLTTNSKIQKLKAQIKKLEQKENILVARKQARALTQITTLVKTSGLSVAQVTTALGRRTPKKNTKRIEGKAVNESKLAGRKIAPKYQNPANGTETWTGRGRAPKWAIELKAAGKLDTALIR